MTYFLLLIFFVSKIPDGNLRETFLKGVEEGLLEIKTTATKSMSAKQCDKKGVIVLGDAFNMRHPIIASGMMVALSDVLILRNLLRPVPSFSNTKKVLELVKSFYIIRKVSSDILFFLMTSYIALVVH